MAARVKKIGLLILALALFALAVHAEQITVAAAADLNYALKDLAARFEHQTGNKVTLSFGASGNFYSQIQSGAPYDVFFSADMDYPQKARRCRSGGELFVARLCHRPSGALGA